MSERYVPIGWSRTKLIYDAVLIFAVCAFLFGFFSMARRAGLATTPTDEGSLPIRAFGSCAFLLLTLALSIGPLTRLDKRFLPLLYNRRHIGIVTFAVAAAHVFTVFDWYLAFSPINPWLGLFVSDAMFQRLDNFPFVPFGALAFLILSVLAATSHDFWLKFLGPGLWKGMHMSLYAAYGLIVAHLSFGALQGKQNLDLSVLVIGSAATLLSLHLAAALKHARVLRHHEKRDLEAGWIRVALESQVLDGRAQIIALPGSEAIAVFRDKDVITAISHRCAHQNGPLGEGRIINGHVVCPWHGHEFHLTTGCAPAPFTDRVPVYPVRIEAGMIYVKPTPVHNSRDRAAEIEP